MDFCEYRREADRLYREYLELWRVQGGHLPPRFNGIWRPQHERFELIIDLTAPTEEILSELEGFKKNILEKREERLTALQTSYPQKAVISDPPTRSDKRKKSPETVIKSAERALTAYKLKANSQTDLVIAIEVFEFKETQSKSKADTAEKNVRNHRRYAENLIKAAGNGQFYLALQGPLPKE